MQVDGSDDRAAAGPSSEKKVDVAKGIEALLPSEEVEAIKSALGTLEMEQAVDELLQRNAKALQLLEELQLERLREQGSGSSIVEVGSEEWDVAQGIIESLALLASLRPRRSNGDADESPLVPTPSVLHKLQRTLPIGTTEGWYGTLPEGRTTAFRDDTTVHIRSTASRAAAAAATTAAATTTAIPTTPAGKTAPVAAGASPAAAIPPYTPYSYSGSYQNSQYRGGYGTYSPGTQGGGATTPATRRRKGPLPPKDTIRIPPTADRADTLTPLGTGTETRPAQARRDARHLSPPPPHPPTRATTRPGRRAAADSDAAAARGGEHGRVHDRREAGVPTCDVGSGSAGG
ncbi:hypothetical protein NUW54_g14459 [Trametes sanguinea]|uniref:Uncharacterized protein n=1 Tax=Trametes sanguinea TaxID=158606 RepID=A0ACC1ME10_9APHY|nr:hypothetical protein NUW54_g14459 [Trametes sanguinea]